MNPTRYHYFVRIPLASMIFALVIVGAFSRRGWIDWRRIVKQNQEIAKRVQLAKLQKDDLESKTEALESDQEAQERVVRRFLGYVRSDETIIEFP